MTGGVVVGILLGALTIWLLLVTYVLIGHGREIQILLVSLKHIAGAEKQIGGTGGYRRRTDFRVPVRLSGFLRVLEHARPCHIVDLSGSGAQVVPDGGKFPIDETGVLTIDFSDFDSGTTHVRIVRAIEATGSYGVEFVDQPPSFRDKCLQTIRQKFREQLGQR